MTTQKLKLIAVTRVKNEADVIEAFVRHHAVHFSKIIVLDDGSSDATPDILRALQQEGAPIVLLNHATIGYDQKYWMTLLMHLACECFGADWVAPLDADEFVECEARRPLTDVLAELPADNPIAIRWSNFAWSREDDRIVESNPVVRLVNRLPPHDDLFKVIVPKSIVVGTEAHLWQGSHFVGLADQPLEPTPVSTVDLCHFPIRSADQYARKVAIGYLQYAADPTATPGLGFQYVDAWPKLLAGGDDWLAFIEGQSRAYSLPLGSRADGVPVDRPLIYEGAPLTKTPDQTTTLTDVLLHAEGLAHAYRDQAALDIEAASSRRELQQSLMDERGQLKVLRRTLSMVNESLLGERGSLDSMRQALAAAIAERDKAHGLWAEQTLLGRWVSRVHRKMSARRPNP